MKPRETFCPDLRIKINFTNYTGTPVYAESFLDPGGQKILVSGYESQPQRTEGHQFIELDDKFADDD